MRILNSPISDILNCHLDLLALSELEKELFNQGDKRSEIIRKAFDTLYELEIIDDRVSK